MDEEKEARMETWGPGGVLGGPGVSESYVVGVRIPTKPLVWFQFGGKRKSKLVHGWMRDSFEWLAVAGSAPCGLDRCGRFEGPHSSWPDTTSCRLVSLQWLIYTDFC